MSGYISKKGFSLTELLVAMLVVGVIIVIAIPIMTGDYLTSQRVKQWRAMYSKLQQVTEIIKAQNSGTLKNAFSSTIYDQNAFLNKYCEHLHCVRKCYKGSPMGDCWPTVNYFKNGTTCTFFTANTSGARAELADGTLLMFGSETPDCNNTDYGGAGEQPTNLCGQIAVKLNGYKTPNKLGVDLFRIWVTSNQLIPRGTNDGLTPANCIVAGNHGDGCATYYLMEDK